MDGNNMAYDHMGADEGGEEAPAATTEARNDTFFMPPDFPGAENLKAGDTVTLRVVGKSSDGEIEVEHVGEPAESDWKTDLRSSMAGPSEGEPEV